MFTTHRKIITPSGLSPAGWWQYREGTGTVSTADNSGNGHTGAMVNFSEAGWDSGPHGLNALRFSAAVSRSVETGVWHPSVETGDLTVMSFINIYSLPPDSTTYYTVVSQVDTTQNQRAFNLDVRVNTVSTASFITGFVTPNGTYTDVSLRNSQDRVANPTIQIAPATWYHVAMRYKQSTQQVDVLIDGVDTASNYLQTNDASRIFPTSTAQIAIGAQFTNGTAYRFFDGIQADTRIYSAWLPDQDILDISDGIA